MANKVIVLKSEEKKSDSYVYMDLNMLSKYRKLSNFQIREKIEKYVVDIKKKPLDEILPHCKDVVIDETHTIKVYVGDKT